MPAAVPPFLTLHQRVEYLGSKGYLFGTTPSDQAVARLNFVNFHYFLGYARNYRMLASKGIVPTEAVLDRVFAIVDADRKLATTVFDGLRALEWRLRAILVNEHCQLFPSTACFLDPSHYRVQNPDAPPLPTLVCKHIDRSREPYLEEQRRDGHQNQDFPIWAVVDTWSFSTLSRVICESVPAVDGDGQERRLWKQVALALGVSASTVTGNLEAISVLRNHIAHHARLWMRPTSPSPRIPKRFPARLRRSVHPKSMYGVFLALAEMLGPDTDGKYLLSKVDAILTSNDQFKHGITQPITP